MSRQTRIKRPKGRTGPTLAEQADRHELYELSVQDVEHEAEFVADTFRALRGREPRGLREDFSGTASAACEWVRHGDERFAIAVDLDAETLDWGREHRVGRLQPAEQQRVKLLCDNVLTVDTPPVDVITAFNFSYWILSDRETLRSYFERVRESLVDDGLLFLDMFGGSESYVTGKEKTKHKGFSYVWEQEEFDPMTAMYTCHIHFHFPDGSKLKRAFSYTWRLWTLVEIRELLAEAGFSKVRVYWETEDEDGEGSGEYQESDVGLNDPAWIIYIVAEK